MCYSTCASGPTVLSMCSRLRLVTNCCSTKMSPTDFCTVLYDAFYSYLCRRYWNGILGPSILIMEVCLIMCTLEGLMTLVLMFLIAIIQTMIGYFVSLSDERKHQRATLWFGIYLFYERLTSKLISYVFSSEN